jgi:hypothetical protein
LCIIYPLAKAYILPVFLSIFILTPIFFRWHAKFLTYVLNSVYVCYCLFISFALFSNAVSSPCYVVLNYWMISEK